MASGSLRSEERVGLGVAALLHAGLVAVLLLRPPAPTVPEVPPRMTVSLATEVGLEASAPEPVAESRAATAPVLADQPAPAPEPAPPEPAARPEPPRTRVQSPVPVPRQAAKPRPEAPATKAPAKASSPKPPATQKGGASRLGDNFLAGAGDSATTAETRVPASKIGASAKASLVQAIARRIKPRWEPPSGPEVEQITTVLRFRLNPDGSLDGRPEVVRQTGITDTNRAQAGRHAELAIRAVQLAAPFDDLPPEYYEAWKRIGAFSFDWRLAQ